MLAVPTPAALAFEDFDFGDASTRGVFPLSSGCPLGVFWPEELSNLLLPLPPFDHPVDRPDVRCHDVEWSIRDR